MELLSSGAGTAVGDESISTSVHQFETSLRAHGSPDQEDVQMRF